MIIVDEALRARAEAGDPVRVAMVGAGFMGRGVANQILNSVPGMELVAISNRHAERAREAYLEAGAEDVTFVASPSELDAAIGEGRHAVTDDPSAVCRADGVEAILEVTGAVDFGARVVLDAIEHGKHAVVLNAELDGTLGPVLKLRADRAGVVYSASDGDQPGVQMNLYRFVSGRRRDPAHVRQHQGPARPVAQPHDAAGLRASLGSEPSHGHELRRRDQDLVRAGHGGQRHRDDGGAAGHAGLRASRPRRRAHQPLRRRRAARPRRDRGLRGRGGARPGRVRPRQLTTIPSNGTTSTSTSWARARCTASTRPITCATSRRRSRSLAPCCSRTR